MVVSGSKREIGNGRTERSVELRKVGTIKNPQSNLQSKVRVGFLLYNWGYDGQLVVRDVWFSRLCRIDVINCRKSQIGIYDLVFCVSCYRWLYNSVVYVVLLLIVWKECTNLLHMLYCDCWWRMVLIGIAKQWKNQVFGEKYAAWVDTWCYVSIQVTKHLKTRGTKKACIDA